MYETYLLQNWITKVKPNINSVEIHPQLRNNGHLTQLKIIHNCVITGNRWMVRWWCSFTVDRILPPQIPIIEIQDSKMN
jgi:hypothetical protein